MENLGITMLVAVFVTFFGLSSLAEGFGFSCRLWGISAVVLCWVFAAAMLIECGGIC